MTPEQRQHAQTSAWFEHRIAAIQRTDRYRRALRRVRAAVTRETLISWPAPSPRTLARMETAR